MGGVAELRTSVYVSSKPLYVETMGETEWRFHHLHAGRSGHLHTCNLSVQPQATSRWLDPLLCAVAAVALAHRLLCGNVVEMGGIQTLWLLFTFCIMSLRLPKEKSFIEKEVLASWSSLYRSSKRRNK